MAGPISLCLDFANTVSWRASAQPQEKLTDYANLVGWGRQAGVVPARQARRMLAHGERSPVRAAHELEHAIAVRESIYRIFASVARGRRVARSDLALLNRAIQAALERLEVVPEAHRFAWRWPEDTDTLEPILWRVARSAAELLTSEEMVKVRVCAGTGCGWLFLDQSRNHTRRWCDMSDCGNREKARRHYQRIRQAKGDKTVTG